MKKLKIPEGVKTVVNIYLKHHVSRAAAALSYSLTLSVFPLLICVSYALSGFDINIDATAELLAGLLPEETLAILINFMHNVMNNQSTALFVGGLILLVTTTSTTYRTLSGVMSEIYGYESPRGLFSTLFSFIFPFIFILAIYLCIFIVISGSWLLDLLESHFHLSGILLVWDWLRFVLLFFVLFLIIGLIYRLSSPRQKDIRPHVLRGAAIASFSLVIVSMVFSHFIGLSARYSLVYGSLAAFVIMMVWLYLCGNVLIIGNVFNYLHQSKTRAKKASAPAVDAPDAETIDKKIQIFKIKKLEKGEKNDEGK